MKNIFSIVLITSSLLIASASYAETVFYKKDTRIASVDCENNNLVLKNFFRTQMSIRKDYDKARVGDICKSLAKFAEEGQTSNSQNSAKSITLLTVEKKSIGDSIYEQEVIGFVDIDYVKSTNSASQIDPVYTQFCGGLGGSARSSATMCLMVSNSGLYFVEFKSPQQYQLNKTRVVSTDGNQIVLESKESDNKIYLDVTAVKIDENTIQVKVSFEGREPVSAILKK